MTATAPGGQTQSWTEPDTGALPGGWADKEATWTWASHVTETGGMYPGGSWSCSGASVTIFAPEPVAQIMPSPPAAPVGHVQAVASSAVGRIEATWAYGTVGTTPGANWYVWLPTCVGITGSTLPWLPLSYSTYERVPSVDGRTTYWLTYSVKVQAEPITWSFGDGFTAQQPEAVGSSPSGDGCTGLSHVYKTVGRVAVAASTRVDVTVAASYWNGSRVVTLPLTQPAPVNVTFPGSGSPHTVLQVEGVPQ